jgi:riboflavin transporter FmnP
MKNQKLNKMIKVSMLSVVAFLLMFFEFATPVFPAFLKIDISDLPALIGTFALGPMAGIGIELLKNILHGIFVGGTAFIGEAANFIVGSVFVATAGICYSRNKNKKNALIGMALGTVLMTATAGIMNYYVLLPLYETVLHFPMDAVVAMGTMVNSNITDLNSFIIWAILPFNILKGVVIALIAIPVYKRVSPVIHGDLHLDREKAS